MSNLTNGFIPANTECPFLSRCDEENSKCFLGHKGKEHEVAFSCAIARVFDSRQKEEK